MRIFIDSRLRTAGTASSFRFELNETFELPSNARVRVHDATIPHCWRTVETGLNWQLFVIEKWADGTEHRRLIYLTPGHYGGVELAAMLKTRFSAVGDTFAGDFEGQAATSQGTTFSGSGSAYNVRYDETTGQIAIELNMQLPCAFAILPDDQVDKTLWGVQSVQSFNRNLRISELQWNTLTSPYVSQFVDLHTIKDVYVHCPTLGFLGNIGPQAGDRNCLAKIAITEGFGFVVHSEGMHWEYGQVRGRFLLRLLDFHLRDVTGALVPLHGSDWSFALTFNDPDDAYGTA